MKIKDKVNKTQLFRDLTEIGKKRFEFTCEPDEDLKVFLDGAEQLFKLLRLPVVSKSVTCDHNYPHVSGWSIHQPSHCSNCGKDL